MITLKSAYKMEDGKIEYRDTAYEVELITSIKNTTPFPTMIFDGQPQTIQMSFSELLGVINHAKKK